MTIARSQPHTSKELVWVVLEEESGLPIDPESVRLAVVAEKISPVESDWRAVTAKDERAEFNGSTGTLRCALMVGPGGAVAPAKGRYVMWGTYEVGDEKPVDDIAPLHLT